MCVIKSSMHRGGRVYRYSNCDKSQWRVQKVAEFEISCELGCKSKNNRPKINKQITAPVRQGTASKAGRPLGPAATSSETRHGCLLYVGLYKTGVPVSTILFCCVCCIYTGNALLRLLQAPERERRLVPTVFLLIIFFQM